MILRKALLLLTISSLTSLPQTSHAALLTFFTKSAFDAQLITNALIPTNPVNFDSSSTGAMGTSFSNNGIGFSSPGPMRIASGVTSSASNFLGYDDGMAPEFQPGDSVNLTLPANSRAVSLNIITDTIPDALTYATLTAGASVNTQGAGTLISGSFSSYFLGIIETDVNSTISNASVTFTNAGFYRLDDVAVAMVPEPNSFALAAIAGLAGVARRRTRRA